MTVVLTYLSTKGLWASYAWHHIPLIPFAVSHSFSLSLNMGKQKSLWDLEGEWCATLQSRIEGCVPAPLWKKMGENCASITLAGLQAWLMFYSSRYFRCAVRIIFPLWTLCTLWYKCCTYVGCGCNTMDLVLAFCMLQNALLKPPLRWGIRKIV